MFKKLNPTHNKLCGGINFYQLAITITAVLFASALVVYGWTAPVGGPPNNDVEPPINTGSTGQVKQGGLTVGSVAGIQLGLGVLNGNVGIGTVTPTSSKGIGGYLDVKDIYLRDASKWASELGGGGVDWSNPVLYSAAAFSGGVSKNTAPTTYKVCQLRGIGIGGGAAFGCSVTRNTDSTWTLLAEGGGVFTISCSMYCYN